MIDPKLKLGPVGLRVADLEKMTSFYSELIGLKVREKHEESVVLGTSFRPLVILRQIQKGQAPKRQSGLFHIAIRVPERKSMAKWIRHYLHQGRPNWQGASNHGVSEAMYLSDPEGNGIEICCDFPESDWKVFGDGVIELVTRPLDLEKLLEEYDDPWDGHLDQGADIGHVHLKVSNVDEAKKFYHHQLGFGIKSEIPDTILFAAAGTYHHHLGLNSWQSRGGGNNEDHLYGLDSFELEFSSGPSLNAFLDRLNSQGLTVDQESLRLRDPFNNLINLKVRADA